MARNRQKVLLIVLPYYDRIFGESAVKVAVSKGTIMLGLAAVGAQLRKIGAEVRILDLNIEKEPLVVLNKHLQTFCPQYVGISLTTPIFKIAKAYAKIIKDKLKDVILIAGGPHPSVLPEDFLRETAFDIVVRGEGEKTISELFENMNISFVKGISYKMSGVVVSSAEQKVIDHLDDLEFPALDLFDTKKYNHPKIVARRNPVASMETSRGCFGKCSFCNKSIFGARYRVKSPQRVIDEMEYILSLGFKEIHIVDDLFTGDLNRAKEICRKLIAKGLNLSWYPRGGVRIDRLDKELIKLMKRAGCYRIPLGIESGDQAILDRINKNITVGQIENIVNMLKQEGMEVEGYFMLGLPGETSDTLEKTLRFSLSLKLDYVKYAITVPLPGTPLFDDWNANGLIKTYDWEKYNFAIPPGELYCHPSVGWQTIYKYYKLAPRKFYLRPSFVLRRFFESIRKGSLFEDLSAVMEIKWF